MNKINNRLRVINWNILHDNSAGKRNGHRLQKDRLAEIADVINNFIIDIPTLVYICEGVNKKNMVQLDTLLAGVNMIDCTAYPNDYMGFYTNITDTKYTEIDLPKMNLQYPKTKAIRLHTDSLTVTGIHQPDEIRIAGALARWRAIGRVISKTPDKQIIVGDFNSLWFQTSRLKLKLAGYKRAVSKWPRKNNSFPDPHFEGRAIPKYTPRLPIDAQYYKGVVLETRQSINTGLSDHPIQICDYFVPE